MHPFYLVMSLLYDTIFFDLHYNGIRVSREAEGESLSLCRSSCAVQKVNDLKCVYLRGVNDDVS